MVCCYTPEIFLHYSWSISHMENRQWQKLAEKKSRHSQKSHGMYWNIIVYHFNCLSRSILTQRDEKYGYSVLDSRWCVRVVFCLFMTYICPCIFTLMAYSSPYFSVNGMMILVLAYKNGFKSESVYYGLQENTFLFMAYRCRATHIYISAYDIRDHSSRPLNRFTYYAIINLWLLASIVGQKF